MSELSSEPSTVQPKPERCCTHCLYWHEFSSDSLGEAGKHTGECRRYPPVIVFPFQMHDILPAECGFWPLTRPEDWCGEFEQRPATG